MPASKAEPAWVQGFLAALGACGNVTRAAALAGIDTTGPYNRRLRYPAFRAAWDRVMAEREARAASFETSLRLGSVPTQDERDAELSVSDGGARRVAASRWSKAAEAVFLTELTVNANVQRAAAAAGFSAAAVYKRKARDRHFSASWEAAIAVGRARLESFLIVQAERNFDPEALPIGEGDPKVTVSEALGILKHRPAAAVAAWDNDADLGPDYAAEVRARIIDKLEQLRQRDEPIKLAEGWTKCGDDWIPPGWVKAEP